MTMEAEIITKGGFMGDFTPLPHDGVGNRQPDLFENTEPSPLQAEILEKLRLGEITNAEASGELRKLAANKKSQEEKPE